MDLTVSELCPIGGFDICSYKSYLTLVKYYTSVVPNLSKFMLIINLDKTVHKFVSIEYWYHHCISS
jgi:hypothetical protein